MGLMNYFVYDGKRSSEYGVWISGGGTYNAPARDVESVAIPGRNGDFHLDNGRYFNVALTYPAFISRDFSRVNDFRAWLVSHFGYHRLEDTYHPDEFRMASCINGFDVTPTARNLSGSFDIIFDCKPQRWLKSGETLRAVQSGDVLHNPTEYAAKPLIRAFGNGSLTVGDRTITLVGVDTYADIDCETQETYCGALNLNGAITLADGEFPEIPVGSTEITFSGFSAVQIAPKWWTL